MRSLVIAIAIAVTGAGCPGHASHPAAPSATTPKEVVDAVKGTLEEWRQAYEIKSMEALAKLYQRDLDLVVVVEGQTLLGWPSVEAALKDKLARATAIHVRLKDIQAVAIGLDAASAVATMTREVTDGTTTVTENGTLTLVLRKTPDGWVISSEHYSYKHAG